MSLRLQQETVSELLSRCFLQVLRTEGPMTFYNGFATYYVRIAPHAMITLMAVETLKNFV